MRYKLLALGEGIEPIYLAGERLGSLLGKKAEEDPSVKQDLYRIATKAPGSAPIHSTKERRWWEPVLQALYRVRFRDAEGKQTSINDQFVPPVVRVDDANQPVGRIQDGDVVLFGNFRTDRPKALTSCLVQLEQAYEGLKGGLSSLARRVRDLFMTTLTDYDPAFWGLLKIGFAGKPLPNTYSEYLVGKNIKVARFMESQKWRAGTWFLDGRRSLGKIMDSLGLRAGRKEEKAGVWSREAWIHPLTGEAMMSVTVVESPKVSYDQAPKMSAELLTDKILEEIRKVDAADDIFVNYANADMVAHASTDRDKFDSVVRAIGKLNEELGHLVPEAIARGYVVAITADHGNAEEMMTKDGKANPSHSKNPIPFILAGIRPDQVKLRAGGILADAAPTFLHLRGLGKPEEMDRESLIEGMDPALPRQKKILRIVLDGWGISQKEEGNAILKAQRRIEAVGGTFWMDRWAKEYASTQLIASGGKTGYWGDSEGTTEFGHVLFEAGRWVDSDAKIINMALENDRATVKDPALVEKYGSFYQNENLLAAIRAAKTRNVNLHLLGIVTMPEKLVHVSFDHIVAILEMSQKEGLRSDQVKIHAITDGRDVEGQSAIEWLVLFQQELDRLGIGEVVDIVGREWALNRDNRWELIEPAYRALVEGTAAMHVIRKAA